MRPRAFALGVVASIATGCTGPSGDVPDTDTDGQADTDAGSSPLLGLSLVPRDPVLGPDDRQPLTVRAFYQDTTSRTVTGQVRLIVEDERVATLDGATLVARSAGRTGVVAELDGVAARITATVRGDAEAPTRVDLQPASPTLAPGDALDLAAVATWRDGTAGPAAGCTWSSSDDAVVTVSSGGTLRAEAVGQATIAASCRGTVGTTEATVQPSVPTGSCNLALQDAVAVGQSGAVAWLAEVRNTGTGPCPARALDAWLDGPPAGLQDARTVVEPLQAGQVVLVELSATASPGPHSTWLRLAPTPPDADDADDTAGPLSATVPAARADLVVADLIALADADGTDVLVEVENLGAAEARDFWIDVFVDREPMAGCDAGEDFLQVSSLPAGDTTTWELRLDGVAAGAVIRATADTCGDVDEEDETNNVDQTTAL